MKKLNKSNSKILTFLILAIVGISVLGGLAYSKYVTQISGDEFLSIAKWSFLVNGKDGSKGENLGTLNLGAKTYTAETLKAERIAPGTSGTFDIEIDATGTEIGVNYKVEAKDVLNKPTNLYFTINDTKYSTVEDMVASITGTINADEVNKTRTITVNWYWDYETGNTQEEIETHDLEDTTDGKVAQDFQFTIVITGTQVNPVEASDTDVEDINHSEIQSSSESATDNN